MASETNVRFRIRNGPTLLGLSRALFDDPPSGRSVSFGVRDASGARDEIDVTIESVARGARPGTYWIITGSTFFRGALRSVRVAYSTGSRRGTLVMEMTASGKRRARQHAPTRGGS